MTWADFLEASTAEKLASGKLEPIAEYLKIDMGDDDTVLIACVTAAVRYIIASVGVFPDGGGEGLARTGGGRRSGVCGRGSGRTGLFAGGVIDLLLDGVGQLVAKHLA